jgi:hypothetical protein
MMTSTRWGNCQVLAGLWLLVPGCGAFSGGQSGTDSLEAIGVVSPETKCDSSLGEGDVGDVLQRANGCEECVCKSNGEWKCEAVACESGSEASTNPENTEANGDPPGADLGDAPSAVSTSQTETREAGAGDCVTEIWEPSLGGSVGVYVAKDDQAEVCLSPVSPTRLCMSGSTVASGEDYTYWGGGMGLAMSTPADGGFAPLDAASLGIEGVRFTVEGVRPPFMLRAYLNQVDSPYIVDPENNFVHNSFLISELSENGVVESLFSNAWPPAWTGLDVDEDGTPDTNVLFDPTQLNSLQFFVVANMHSGFDFDVCISDVEWIDSAGDVVLPQ